MNQTKINTTLSELKNSTKLLAVCEITGILVYLDRIPACTAVLEYRNPLADLKNILSLVERESELVKLPKEVLAGMLLALLKSKKLLESKLSSVEQNLLLQEASTASLVKLLSLLARTSKKQAVLLCKMSLDSELLLTEQDSKASTISSLLTNKTKVWGAFLFPSLFLDASRTTGATVLLGSSTIIKVVKEKKEKSAVTVELKTEIKRLVKLLISEEVASDKVIKLLFLSLEKDNLLSLLAKDGLGNKLISVLTAYQTTTAVELAKLLAKVQSTLTYRDKAEQLFCSDLERVSDSSISKSKKTLKEILAEKLNKPVEEKIVEATAEEVDKLEAFLDSSTTKEETEETTEADTCLSSIGLVDEDETEELPTSEAEEENENEF